MIHHPSRSTSASGLLWAGLALGLFCAAAQAAPFALPGQGCPMGHCDSHLSDSTHATSPSVATLIRADTTTPGSGHGLGCVSDTHIVACSLAGSASSNLVVYDGDGNRLWDDGGVLGATAEASAPIIGIDGTVIAADQNFLLRADPATGSLLWKSAKPDVGLPISPVLVGADSSMVLLATYGSTIGPPPEMSVWDVSTGALLSHKPLVDPTTGELYVTLNTTATNGNRAYVLASKANDTTTGRLYAVDVCNADSCGGRGTTTLAWHYDFAGPSGASPLVIGSNIYFDGRPAAGGGTFMSVVDRGTSARLAWKKAFAGEFVAGAAQDPRGGLWVFPFPGKGALLRLDASSGATMQTVSIAGTTGLQSGYTFGSAVTVSQSSSGAVVLTACVRPISQGSLPSYVTAFDVSSTPSGTALWQFEVASANNTNSAEGQFPIVVNASGSRRIVFSGTHQTTFFVGEP